MFLFCIIMHDNEDLIGKENKTLSRDKISP